MAYPFNLSFETEPDAAFITTLGGMAVTHNPDLQSLDIAAPASPSILRFNEAAHGDFWFEADVELLSDPSASQDIGLWMTTGNGGEGYRFAHRNGAWRVTRWSSGFGDGAAVAGGLNPDIPDGAAPTAGTTDTAPTFQAGQRLTLRCDVTVGAFDANGVPWARLMRFTAGGVVMCQTEDATYRGKLVPGVCLYGATARLHAIAGGTPSGLPAFPATVGVNAADDLLPLVGGSTSVLPDPAAPIGVRAPDVEAGDLMRLNSPASDLWIRGGGCDAHHHTVLSGRQDIHFGGHGFIAGTVSEKGQAGQANAPLVRRVQLFSDNTRILVAETWSDATGAYRFLFVDPSQRYTVLSHDHQGLYRAVVADKLKPEPMP